jgi:AraC-like DNA-binding protein
MTREPASGRDRERPPAAQRLTYFSGTVGVGRFRCMPESSLWREENHIGVWPLVAFPETTVRIHQADRDPVVANPNHAMLYRAGQPYRRELIAPEGDRCTYVVVRPSVLAEMVALLGRPTDPACPEFPRVDSPIPPAAFLAHRTAVRRIAASPQPDELALDELILSSIRSIVAAGVPRAERPAERTRARTAAAHAEAVEQAKEVLSRRFAERLSLEGLAREVHASPFHLARVFRRGTGLALHEYRNQLRLRAAVHRLDGGESLADVAATCGFASHSHLTDSFRRAFGATPSAIRALG